MSSDLQTQLTEAEKSFKKACEQIIHLNRRLDEMAKRYDKASRENHRSFRYSLRLRMAVSEGVRNMYYEYAANKADRISELRFRVSASNGSGSRSSGSNNVVSFIANSHRRDVNVILADRSEGERRERSSVRESGSSARTNPNVAVALNRRKTRMERRLTRLNNTRRENESRHHAARAEHGNSSAAGDDNVPVLPLPDSMDPLLDSMVPNLESVVADEDSVVAQMEELEEAVVNALEEEEENPTTEPTQEGNQDDQYDSGDIVPVVVERIPEPAVSGNPESRYDSSDIGSPSAGSSGSTIASESPEDMELTDPYFTSDDVAGSQAAGSDWTNDNTL